MQLSPSEQNLFLALLRMSLWQESPASVQNIFNEEVSWQNIWKVAHAHTLDAFIASSLTQFDRSIQDRTVGFLQLKAILGKNVLQHEVLNKTVVEIFDFMQGRGCHPVLLKGQGTASLYPFPKLRQCGDIDVLVNEDEYKSIRCCIGSLVGSEEASRLHETSKHFHVFINGTILEVHRHALDCVNPFLRHRFRQVADHYIYNNVISDSIDIEGRDIAYTSAQFNVFFTFSHLWHHLVTGGVGLRQLCDLCMVLHNAYGRIDLSRLESDLRSCHLFREWQLLSWINVHLLGLPLCEMPFYTDCYHDISLRLWDFIVSEGNFGRHKDNNPIKSDHSWLSYKLLRLSFQTRRLFRVFPFSPSFSIWGYFFYLL